MKCPKCNKKKEHDDFYWNHFSGFKSYNECKDCIKELRDEKKKNNKPKEGFFDEKEFAKSMLL